MCDVYSIWSIFLYFCRDFWTEILPIEAFCVGWNQYNRILHDKSSSIFSPRESICKYFSTSQHKKSYIIFKTTLTSAGVCVVLGVGTYIFSSLCRCNERKVPPNFAFTTNTTWLMTCRDTPSKLFILSLQLLLV